ncbi:Alkylated DNA repair protein alkB 8 [Rhodotorula mucilaginosa]|uniref:Alkylated DNA repair protein alkB 8 n=1 Tax=Rhodotorula mucilaginosa TaxID=5537 RepID=A0A9P7B2P8_RHOMI|nr:Alkylated DNA repair protein alkB 8 [Rhodotorula mucilaginosa]
MTEATTAAFEAEHVHAVYDEIAADFSRTRHSPWPFVRHFLDALPPAALVLDAGTGNGKYLGARSVLDYTGKHDPPPTRRRRAQESETPASKNDMLAIGFDMSIGLLSIASERGHEVDHAISIATIHHFATPERRIESIKVGPSLPGLALRN